MSPLSSRGIAARACLLALALFFAPRGADAMGAASSGLPSTFEWFRRFFSSFAVRRDTSCPPVPTASPFDLSMYVESHPWYVQEQQPNAYQPASSLFCVRAAYAWEDAAKTRVAVLNTGNEGKVDGPRSNERKTKLRAVVPDVNVPSKLAVGPRFVPKSSYGPYWVVAVGGDPEAPSRGYDWAVVSGGQPNVPVEGKDTCRTKLTGVNGSGLWIFTKDPTPSSEVIQEARDAAADLGIDLSEMLAVTHEGCEYPEA